MNLFFILAVIALSQQPTKLPESGGVPETARPEIRQQPNTSKNDNYDPNRPIGIDQSTTGNKQTTKTDQDVDVQRKLVLYTGLLVVAGFITAGLIFWQACETNRAASAAKEAAQAALKNAQAVIDSERAWLLVEDVVVIDNVSTWDHYPVIKNFGKTVARITKVCGISCVLDIEDSLPEKPDFRNATTSEINFVLYPTGKIDDAVKIIVDYETVKEVNKASSLYLYGYVEYLDFANTPRYAGFCVMQSRRTGFRFRPDTHCPSAYNKCT